MAVSRALSAQASFSGGELTPSAWGRVDLDLYQNHLKTCRNFWVRPYGGVQNRPGTRYVGTMNIDLSTAYPGGGGQTADDGGRLIPFRFNDSQTMVISMIPGLTAFWKNGAAVLRDVVYLGIDRYYRTNPYTSSELRQLQFAQINDVITITHQNHCPQQLRRHADNNWDAIDFPFKNGPFQDTNTDVSVSVWASAVMGQVTIMANSPIFTSGKVGQLFRMEQRDFGIPWQPVDDGILIGDIRVYDGRNYQAVTAGTTGNQAPIHTSDKASDGGVTWMFLDYGYGVAAITAVASDGLSCTATVTSRFPFGGANTGFGTRHDVSQVEYLNNGNTVRLTSVGHGVTTDGTAFFHGVNDASGTIAVHVEDADHITISTSGMGALALSVLFGPAGAVSGCYFQMESSNSGSSTYKWAFGAWGGDQGWPGAIAYWNQRLWFAGTPGQPNTIWASRVGDFTDFSTSNPIEDDDPITITLASGNMDAIRALFPIDQLVVLTAGAVWVSRLADGEAPKPNNFPIKIQTFGGGSTLPLLGIGGSALYLQSKGKVVQDLVYQFASNRYDGKDLTALAAHLLEGHAIVDWAYQQTPDKTIWAVRDDGVLLGLTYFPEQNVIAWHRHDTTQGKFKAVCCVSEGDEDAVYFSVDRSELTSSTNFHCYLERLENRVFQDIKDAIILDCSLSRTFTNPVTTISGLPHLNGATVSVFADGKVQPQKTVVNGSITLDTPASVVHVGLPITGDFETLDLNIPGVETILPRAKAIPAVTVLMEETKSLKVGKDFDHLIEQKARFITRYDDPLDMTPSKVQTRIPTTWSSGGQIAIRVTDPVPVSILAVIPEIEVGG